MTERPQWPKCGAISIMKVLQCFAVLKTGCDVRVQGSWCLPVRKLLIDWKGPSKVQIETF